ncbi:hypothetical protein COB57_01105 [Candidatus Peregrinibacteria bacterium]|nr:MAG: hypothetical protein COB57_01105 [Candidatus Peregrinibacteria bacterium]
MNKQKNSEAYLDDLKVFEKKSNDVFIRQEENIMPGEIAAFFSEFLGSEVGNKEEFKRKLDKTREALIQYNFKEAPLLKKSWQFIGQYIVMITLCLLVFSAPVGFFLWLEAIDGFILIFEQYIMNAGIISGTIIMGVSLCSPINRAVTFGEEDEEATELISELLSDFFENSHRTQTIKDMLLANIKIPHIRNSQGVRLHINNVTAFDNDLERSQKVIRNRLQEAYKKILFVKEEAVVSDIQSIIIEKVENLEKLLTHHKNIVLRRDRAYQDLLSECH